MYSNTRQTIFLAASGSNVIVTWEIKKTGILMLVLLVALMEIGLGGQ